MAKRTPAQVYSTALAAGFSPDQAVILTAIAGAESGYRNDALGDTALQDLTWGPSFGLFQIRTLRAQTGGGGPRDISSLAGSDLAQAQAAYVISRQGTDWSPWSVYRTGRYEAFLPSARTAAGQAPTAADPPLPGPWWLPWNLPWAAGEAAGDTAAAALSGVRSIALEGVALVLGLGLVGVGVWRLSARPRRRLTEAVAG